MKDEKRTEALKWVDEAWEQIDNLRETIKYDFDKEFFDSNDAFMALGRIRHAIDRLNSLCVERVEK